MQVGSHSHRGFWVFIGTEVSADSINIFKVQITPKLAVFLFLITQMPLDLSLLGHAWTLFTHRRDGGESEKEEGEVGTGGQWRKETATKHPREQEKDGGPSQGQAEGRRCVRDASEGHRPHVPGLPPLGTRNLCAVSQVRLRFLQLSVKNPGPV